MRQKVGVNGALVSRKERHRERDERDREREERKVFGGGERGGNLGSDKSVRQWNTGIGGGGREKMKVCVGKRCAVWKGRGQRKGQEKKKRISLGKRPQCLGHVSGELRRNKTMHHCDKWPNRRRTPDCLSTLGAVSLGKNQCLSHAKFIFHYSPLVKASEGQRSTVSAMISVSLSDALARGR